MGKEISRSIAKNRAGLRQNGILGLLCIARCEYFVGLDRSLLAMSLGSSSPKHLLDGTKAPSVCICVFMESLDNSWQSIHTRRS